MNSGIPEQIKQALADNAEKIVIELLEYNNMDFNEEEQHQHDRRVTFVKDSLLTALAPHFTQQGEDRAVLDEIESVWATGKSVAWVELCMRAAKEGFRTAHHRAARLNTEIKTK
jgi:hypothetical protein